MSQKRKRLKRRNPLHAHPLLKKSAVHEKTVKALRRAQKIELRREWPGENASVLVLSREVIRRFALSTPALFVL